MSKLLMFLGAKAGSRPLEHKCTKVQFALEIEVTL